MRGKKLLDEFTLDVLLNRLSCELIENHFDFRNSILIGLQPRGVFVLNKLVKKLKKAVYSFFLTTLYFFQKKSFNLKFILLKKKIKHFLKV